MTLRVTVGVVALAGVSVCGVLSTLANLEMTEMVNARLPKEKQFAALGWYLSKYQRLHNEYRRLYPDGHLLFKIRSLMTLTFAFLLTCAWAFGLFSQ